MSSQSQLHEETPEQQKQSWIRGVNLGGWLLAERFITPYLFALNECHVQGDLCFYPGQVLQGDVDQDVYRRYNTSNLCDAQKCPPIRPIVTKDGNSDYHPLQVREYHDYPVDEWTLGAAFASYNTPHNNAATTTTNTTTNTSTIAAQYMERHWDTFVTQQDLERLAHAGVTHLRVPLPYWILGNTDKEEPYIVGNAWTYFERMCGWARDLNLQVWPDLHGAPGSQNGFDNSGHYLGGWKGGQTCDGWSKDAVNVQRTLEIVTEIATQIKLSNIDDVVTGFGLLNEPFLDCDEQVLRQYYQDGLHIVRGILGDSTAIFLGDLFQAWKFNDGQFWTNSKHYANTYLDSHPYHVFFEKGRAMTPKQHIAYVCRHGREDVESCCYEDAPVNNTVPSQGISRIIGEWSGAYDVLPTALTPHIMKTIASQNKAPLLSRQISPARRAFLKDFVQAQMVTYEASTSGVSQGWFFWNFKTEGGAFAEWNFLRGLEEGWIPNPLPASNVAAEEIFGSCMDIYNASPKYDYDKVVEEYPDPHTLDWMEYQGWEATDDLVVNDPDIPPPRDYRQEQESSWIFWHKYMPLLVVLLCIVVLARKWLFGNCLHCKRQQRSSAGYEQIK